MFSSPAVNEALQDLIRSPWPSEGEGTADLHVHTTASHGRFSPTRQVQLAASKGLRAVGITDHNTMTGCLEALDAGEHYGIEVIQGIEISAEWRQLEMHLLGLLLDYREERCREAMDKIEEVWWERYRRMIAKARRNLGVVLALGDIYYGGHVPVVGPLAAALAERLGMEQGEAMRRFLYLGGDAYEPPVLTIAEACRLVHHCGGVAVMAHPYGYDRKWVQWTENDFAELKEMGVDGLEAWYPSFGEEGTLDLLGIAERYGFCVSGGSDCHGFAPGKQSKLGCIRMPYRAVEQLKRAASTRAQVR